jgi:putative transposase
MGTLSPAALPKTLSYNPRKHHRQSLRLKGHDYTTPGGYFITICAHQRQHLFGEVVGGQMQLNQLGIIVQAHWRRLPQHHPNLQLDAFITMPNHIHGILMITPPAAQANPVRAGSASNPSHTTNHPQAKPALPSHKNSAASDFSLDEMGAGLGAELLQLEHIDGCKPAPAGDGIIYGCKPAPAGDGIIYGAASSMHGIPEMIRQFKTFSARRINQVRKTQGCSVWQRNYYEIIVRDEIALTRIRTYIQRNPLAWAEGRLNPDNPSK